MYNSGFLRLKFVILSTVSIHLLVNDVVTEYRQILLSPNERVYQKLNQSCDVNLLVQIYVFANYRRV